MSEQDKQIIRNCIKFYDERGWDWSYVVEFLLRELTKKKNNLTGLNFYERKNMSNQLSDSLKEHEFRTELLLVLNKMVNALETQNTIVQDHIQTVKRMIAVQILNSKINAKVATAINALSITDHREFLDLINQV